MSALSGKNSQDAWTLLNFKHLYDMVPVTLSDLPISLFWWSHQDGMASFIAKSILVWISKKLSDYKGDETLYSAVKEGCWTCTYRNSWNKMVPNSVVFTQQETISWGSLLCCDFMNRNDKVRQWKLKFVSLFPPKRLFGWIEFVAV